MSNTPAPPSRSRAVGVETVVGLFVAMVFLALSVFTIVISGSTLFNKNLSRISVALPDGMGLKRSDPVIARGTPVGTVERVYYAEGMVHVDAILDSPVVLHEGYDITVVSTSILGGRQLVIKEGDLSGPAIEDTSSLVGSTPADLFEDATEIVSHVSQGEGPLGKIIFDDVMATNLAAIIDNLRVVSVDISNFTAKVTSGEGTLGRIIYDDILATNLTTGIADIRAAAADISNMTAKVTSGEGTLGRLFYDDKLSDDLAEAVDSIKTIASRLENGEGTLGKLLDPADTQAWDDLKTAIADAKDSIANLKAISERLENGEGTLGKLLSSDTEMYDNFNGLLKDGRELLDDMREASPVSTLSDLALGAF